VPYRECIWDHAAGDIIVQEAGGHVVDFNSTPLDYSKGIHSIHSLNTLTQLQEPNLPTMLALYAPTSTLIHNCLLC
jgi:3'-phosphoadenosine 5'-phosphosulfate (PAPS) 3'-phosphatase